MSIFVKHICYFVSKCSYNKVKIYEAYEKIEKVYGWEIANRIKTIYNKQVWLNMDFNSSAIKPTCR